jgi:hypothetical protein
MWRRHHAQLFWLVATLAVNQFDLTAEQIDIAVEATGRLTGAPTVHAV